MNRPSSDEDEEPETFRFGYAVEPIRDESTIAFRERIQEIPPFHTLGPRLSLIRDGAGAHPPLPRRRTSAPPQPSLPVVTPESPPEFQILPPQVFPRPEPPMFYAFTGPPIRRRSDMGPRVYLVTNDSKEHPEESSSLDEDVSAQEVKASDQQERHCQKPESSDEEDVYSEQSTASSRPDSAETKK